MDIADGFFRHSQIQRSQVLLGSSQSVDDGKILCLVVPIDIADDSRRHSRILPGTPRSSEVKFS